MKILKPLFICLLSFSSLLSICCIACSIYNIVQYSKWMPMLYVSPTASGTPLEVYLVWILYVLQFFSNIIVNSCLTVILIRKNALADFKEWRKQKKEKKLIKQANDEKNANEIAELKARIQEIKNRKDG